MSSIADVTKKSEVLLNTVMTSNQITPSYAGRPVMRPANVKQIHFKMRERDDSVHKPSSPKCFTIAQRERMRIAIMTWCNKQEQAQQVSKSHNHSHIITNDHHNITTTSTEVKPMRTEYLRHGNWYAVESNSGKPEWADVQRQVPVGGRVRRANPRFA